MTTNLGPGSLDVSEGFHSRKPGDSGCWHTIGVSGDQSCPELSKFIHCRNCPVFADAARTFFDRPAPEGYLAGWSQWLADLVDPDTYNTETSAPEETLASHGNGPSFLIFRLGPEWLAFRTQTVDEVTTSRPIHQVPHRTNKVFLGLVNLRGQAQLCVSLHGLLGITTTTSQPRLVLLRDQERAEAWAFGADEVVGVQRVPRKRWRAVPSTLANPSVGFSQAVLSWNERSIGLLDEMRVFAALRSFGP
jgi:chemotaxis-related protein WspD